MGRKNKVSDAMREKLEAEVARHAEEIKNRLISTKLAKDPLFKAEMLDPAQLAEYVAKDARQNGGAKARLLKAARAKAEEKRREGRKAKAGAPQRFRTPAAKPPVTQATTLGRGMRTIARLLLALAVVTAAPHTPPASRAPPPQPKGPPPPSPEQTAASPTPGQPQQQLVETRQQRRQREQKEAGPPIAASRKRRPEPSGAGDAVLEPRAGGAWPGFKNPAGTLVCYVNTALTMLRCLPFVSYLDSHASTGCTEGGCTECILAKLYKTDEPCLATDILSLRPLATISKAIYSGRKVVGHELQRVFPENAMACANEFLQFLLLRMPRCTLFDFRLQETHRCNTCGALSTPPDGGMLRNLLLFAPARDEFSVTRLIRDLFAPKSVALTCKGESCDGLTATASADFLELPKVLLIVASRFASETAARNERPLAFEPTITLRKRAYHLSAVGCHAGLDSRSGHWFAFGRDTNGEWWKYDDHRVSKERPNAKLAVLLVYTAGEKLKRGRGE